MEMNFREWRCWVSSGVSSLVFVEQAGTKKRELRFSRLKWVGVSGIVIFVTVVLFIPDESDVKFSHKSQMLIQSHEQPESTQAPNQSALALWASPMLTPVEAGAGQVNQNTSMIVRPGSGNAKTQIRAGVRLPCRFIDKFTVSQEQVPVIAELILDSVTESGLRLPAGTKLYGEASFRRGGDRAGVQFKQLSIPSGEIRPISGIVAGKDGQLGIPGRVFSDGMKNTAGQVLSTFVGGFASGSMQASVLGQSQGGLQNGLLNAVSQTAQSRAQGYGQKLQSEREWIEVPGQSEGDAILSESINLQEGGEL